jgi:hypothetical protein
MGLIKEPIDVDFFVINREMTPEEVKRLKQFIARSKAQRAAALKRKAAKAALNAGR